MAPAKNKTILIVIRHSPYGSSLAKASLDVALANAAFDQAVDLLFIGDGVLQLLPEQDSRMLGIKNVGRQLASLPMYDINRVYVDAYAVARYNIDLSRSPIDTQALDQIGVHNLMADYDHLLGF